MEDNITFSKMIFEVELCIMLLMTYLILTHRLNYPLLFFTLNYSEKCIDMVQD